MEYVVGRSIESFGDVGEFGLKILVSLGRELTENDRIAFYRAAVDLQKALLTETLRLDPARAERRKLERDSIIGIFAEPIFVEEIPNGYCSDWCCSDRPWFIVTTRIGRITIGWRKRVIEINWNGSAFKWTAESVFPSEAVTKDGCLIHAWGIEKAREYVAVILTAFADTSTATKAGSQAEKGRYDN